MAVLTLLEYMVNPDTLGPAYDQFTVIVAVPCAVAEVMAGVPNVVKVDVAVDVAPVPVAVTVNEYVVFPDPPVKLNVVVPVGAESPVGVLIESELPVGAVHPTARLDPVWENDEKVGGRRGITVIVLGFVFEDDAPFA